MDSPSPSLENNVTADVGQSGLAHTCAFVKTIAAPDLVV